jgi:hypothetical protein
MSQLNFRRCRRGEVRCRTQRELYLLFFGVGMTSDQHKRLETSSAIFVGIAGVIFGIAIAVACVVVEMHWRDFPLLLRLPVSYLTPN